MQLQFTIPLTLVLIAFGLTFDIAPQPGHDGLVAIAFASMGCGAILYLAPRRAGTMHKPLLDAALATVVLTTVLLAWPGVALDSATLLRCAGTCFLLITVGLYLLALCGEAARPFLVAGFAALLAVPLWLGPLAELAGNSLPLTNSIVAMSPLSAFAVAVDIDILRTNWFYEHSVLGSLRYEYPAWGSYVAVLVAGAALLLFAARSPLLRINRSEPTALTPANG